jgi:hypothetical protein
MASSVGQAQYSSKRDVRCAADGTARDGQLQVFFSTASGKVQQGGQKGRKGGCAQSEKFSFPAASVKLAAAAQVLDFEARVAAWIQAQGKFTGRSSATTGDLLKKHPNGFVLVHGSQVALTALAGAQVAQPQDGIQLLIPLPWATVQKLASRETQKDASEAIRALVCAHPGATPPLLEALAPGGGAPGRLLEHGMLRALICTARSCGPLPLSSTHVLMAVSKGAHATNCKLECFGGKRHLGETTRGCALREFEEESGVPITSLSLAPGEGAIMKERNETCGRLFFATVAHAAPPLGTRGVGGGCTVPLLLVPVGGAASPGITAQAHHVSKLAGSLPNECGGPPPSPSAPPSEASS